MSNFFAPVYAKADNKAQLRFDPITGVMPADQLVVGSVNNGFRRAGIVSGDLTNTVPANGTAQTTNALPSVQIPGTNTFKDIPVPKNGDLIITNGAITTVTLPSLQAGVDDFKEVVITSDTAFAHVIVAGAGNMISSAGATVAQVTLQAIRGAMIKLQAYNGKYYVKGSIGTTTFA